MTPQPTVVIIMVWKLTLTIKVLYTKGVFHI